MYFCLFILIPRPPRATRFPYTTLFRSDVEDLAQISHRTGVGDDDVHGRHERPVPAHTDHPARGGVGDERIVRGRSPTGRPGLLAEAEGREARRRRRSGPVRGT